MYFSCTFSYFFFFLEINFEDTVCIGRFPYGNVSPSIENCPTTNKECLTFYNISVLLELYFWTAYEPG